MEKNLLSVITFNIRFGLAPDKDNSWEKRKSLVLKTVHCQSPDFLCIQEANNFQLDFLKYNLKNYYSTGEYKYYQQNWQDIPIFYKKSWQCIFTDHFFLSKTPSINSKFRQSVWPRQCVISLFYKKNRFLCVTNTHFDFKDIVQKKSALLIKEKLKSYNNDIPKIICGDFNSDPTGICYNTFTQLENGQRFKDPFKNLHTPTFHGFTGVPKTGRIDWILYSGGIKPINKEIIKTSYNGKYPSDHFPVKVQFKCI